MRSKGGRPRTHSQTTSIPLEVPISTPDSLEDSSSDLQLGLAEMRGILDEGSRYPSY